MVVNSLFWQNEPNLGGRGASGPRGDKARGPVPAAGCDAPDCEPSRSQRSRRTPADVRRTVYALLFANEVQSTFGRNRLAASVIEFEGAGFDNTAPSFAPPLTAEACKSPVASTASAVRFRIASFS